MNESRASEDETEVSDADLPDDEDEDAAPPPDDDSATPVDPESGEEEGR
jgi:hypothetical protein